MTRRIFLALLGLLLSVNGALASGMLVSPCGKSACGLGGIATSPAGGPDPLCNAMSISDAEIAAWCVVVGGANTSAAETGILSTMATGLKSDLGITALNQKFDRFSIYALGTRPAAKVDLANRATLVENGSLTWTALKGYTGNGTNAFLDSGLLQSTAPNYTTNSGHYGAWAQTIGNNAAFAAYAGVRTGSVLASVLALNSPITNPEVYGINDSGGGVFAAGVLVPGLRIVERSGSNASGSYLNGAPNSTNNTASTGVNARNFLFLANWNTGLSAIANFSNATLGAGVIGASLGAAGQLAVFNRMHTALNALSAANFP